MKKTSLNLVLGLSLVLILTLVFGVKQAWAANFSTAWLRYDRMKAETLSSLQVLFVPATAGTEDRVVIVFASATVGSSQAVTVTNLPTGTTALPGTLVAAGGGTSIAITGVDDLDVGSTYAFNLSVGVSTPAAGSAQDTLSTRSDATTVIDSTSVTSRYITNDQIVITAVVPPTFNFVLSGNTDVFTGNLDSGTTSVTGGNTVTVSTNASKGWIAWVKSANVSLSSATTGETIPTTGSVDGSPSTLSAGSNGYLLDVDLTTDHASGTGSVTIAPEYNGTDVDEGGTLSSTFQQIATADGTTAGDVITLIERAAISAIMSAASDYTDTLTVIGAGAF